MAWLLGSACLSPSLAGAALDTDKVSYYFDSSGSMCGYLKGDDPARTMQKIVDAAMRSKDPKLDRHVFLLGSDGKKPTVVPASDDLANQVAHHAASGSKKPCAAFVAVQSSLDGVFLRSQQTPATSMILVTDLLLKEAELNSFVNNIRDWAGTPGNEGAHVGFVTLNTPFDGPYYQVSGGQSKADRHTRPLTVMWFAASAAGRAEVDRLLKVIGARSSDAIGPAATPSPESGGKPSASAPAQPPVSGPSASTPRARGTDSQSGPVMFGLQILPQLTMKREQWLVPLPERAFSSWLRAELTAVTGPGRNARSIEGCVRQGWASNNPNSLRLSVQEYCSDKELFPYKEARMQVKLIPVEASGLTLQGVRMPTDKQGAVRCVRIEANGKRAPCNDGEAGNVLELYRLPQLGPDRRNQPIETQTIELVLAMADPDEAGITAAAGRLDIADDRCPPAAKPSDCRALLDGKVYRYATFVVQVSNRAARLIQQRMAGWPRSLQLEVQGIRAK